MRRAVLAAVLIAGCSKPASEISPPNVPVLELSMTPTHAEIEMSPIRLSARDDTLWVSFRGSSLLQAYSLDLEPLLAVALDDPVPASPTSIAVLATKFVITDHQSGQVAIYGRHGKLRESFDSLPDGKTRLSPLALAEHDGILYVADISTRRILAIAHEASEGLREVGELLLTIPHDSSEPIGFPSAVHVTPDGRLLVGDAKSGMVRVFTCDGRPVYEFGAVPGIAAMAPQGFAQDDVRDPSLEVENGFDPSGIRVQGRFHVADAMNKTIHVFSPTGDYLFSYASSGTLETPSDIEIVRGAKMVFVADPGANRILRFRYSDKSNQEG